MASATANAASGFLDTPASTPSTFVFSDKDREHYDGYVDLAVKGQGVLVFRNNEQKAFEVKFEDVFEEGDLVLHVEEGSSPTTRVCKDIKNEEPIVLGTYSGVCVDKEPDAPYWVSFDGERAMLKYGIGETRENLVLINQSLGDSTESMKKVKRATFSKHLKLERFQRDPIVIDPPLVVIPTEKITMEDAAKGTYTVPANLTQICRRLYDNISGDSFKLNTSDFPYFTAAIERSIKDKGGWCHKKLRKKKKGGVLEETYLRIMLGVDQGESPGIPYVMEIWPPGHYSPIHNHAKANAIIRVLYGQIHVSLYSMLSKFHETPYLEADFEKDDVTWISPTLNQTHKLMNIHKDGPTCITIQCYMYATHNDTHYEYFDYLEKGSVEHFYPESDNDFLKFKEKMKNEWKKYTESQSGQSKDP